MPEPDTDKFRLSPEMGIGLEKPEPYPRREFPYMTDDEAYQFREPDAAYANGSMVHELPDGLQSEGQFPRHWGETPVRNEDNTRTIRHNPDDYPTPNERARLSQFRGSVAHHIKDPAERKAFISKQGDLEAKGENALDRPMFERLYGEAQDLKNKSEVGE